MDGALTGITTQGQSGSESNGNEEVLYILQTLRLESYYQMQFNVINRTLNDLKFCYLTLILFNIIYLSAHS